MKLRNIIIVGAILSIIAGFTFGKLGFANAPAPGSNADPVVSKSYVDQAVQNRITELEKTVAELTVQAQAMQITINDLQAKINKTTTPAKTTPTTPTTPSTTTPTTPTTPPTTPSAGDSSLVGKVAYNKSGTSVINLRSTPSTEASIVQKINTGEPMAILEVKGEWYQVKLGSGTTGWVANWVVEVK